MFVTFKSMEFVNYKGIKHSNLVLDDRGVLLIKGVNNDKTGSNGAGKSTISSGLLWCLYDRTLAGKETEGEIITDPKFTPKKEFKKEGCRVTVVVLREDIEYHITRHRKHPEFKNNVVLKKRVKDKFDNLSKCVDKETNELIVDIIGADFDSFVHSNVFSFNNIEPFLGRSDKDKKELILPTFFIEKFRAAYKNTIVQIKEVEADLQNLNNDEIAVTVERVEKTSQAQNVKNDIIAYDAQVEVIKGRIKEEQNKQEELSSQVEGKKKILKNIEIELETLKENIDKNADNIRLCQNNQTAYDDLIRHKLLLEKNLSESQLKMSELKNNSSDLSVHKLAELNNEVEVNTNKFAYLNENEKEILAGVNKEEQLFSSILETKKKIDNKINTQIISLNGVERNIAQVSITIKQLNQQKDDVLNKYFSEECKTCKYNKIQEVLSDIKVNIDTQTKSLKESESTLKLIQDAIEQSNNKKTEVEGYETEVWAKINKLKTGALAPVQNELLIVSSKLHDLKDAIIKVQGQVDNAKTVIKDISDIQEGITDSGNRVEAAKKAIINFGDRTLAQAELKKQMELSNTLKNDLPVLQIKQREAITVFGELAYDIKAIEHKVKELIPQTAPPSNLLSRQLELGLALDDLRKKKESIDDKKKSKGEKLEILKFWKVGFSSAGVEGFMLDSILNNMNTLVAKYLGYLSNNTIALTLLPDKSLKSGETRNKISEHVDNDSGGPTYKSSSSGERRIMDIAVLFTLKYIYEQITKTKYNLVFMDEVFDSLDASTCSLVITLLHSMSDINSIFVVSHSESIALEFDSFITATKTKGITELS